MDGAKDLAWGKKFFGNRLGNQGGISPGSIIDKDHHLNPLLYPLMHQLGRFFDHLRLKHSFNHFIEGMGLFVGHFIAHIDRRNQRKIRNGKGGPPGSMV